MNDWRVCGTIIAGVLCIAWAWSSAWVEHQCETTRYERHHRNPPPPGLLTPVTQCVGSEERAYQAGDPQYPAPSRNWPEMKIETATLIVIALTFLAVLWQAYETRREANAVIESYEQNAKHFALLNQQWIDISDVFCTPFIVEDHTDGIKSAELWMVELKISNNTPLKVRVLSIEYVIDGNLRTHPVPRIIGPRNHWRTSIPSGLLSGACISALNSQQPFGLLFVGRIHFVNALGDTVVQAFAKRDVITKRERIRLRGELGGDHEQLFQETVARQEKS
jgi:cbb3-type cytochrome oxidase subunit 3